MFVFYGIQVRVVYLLLGISQFFNPGTLLYVECGQKAEEEDAQA